MNKTISIKTADERIQRWKICAQAVGMSFNSFAVQALDDAAALLEAEQRESRAEQRAKAKRDAVFQRHLERLNANPVYKHMRPAELPNTEGGGCR